MKDFLARMRAAFENLSLRERVLVSAAAATLIVAVLTAGVLMPVLSAGDGVQQSLDAAEQQLAAMKRLRREFDDVNGRLRTVEERIQNGPRGNLRTTLEGLARQASVKIESMEPQASPANEAYRETKVEVTLASVSLAQAINYLHQIEASGQQLSIKTLRLRVRADNPELLDVRFTVSSFEPV